MTAPVESEDRLSPRTRTILVWGLMALGALILLVGSLTVWVKRQALDTDAWVNSSTELLANEDVRNALSIYIVDQLYEYGDVEGRLEERLPPNLAGLAAPIAGSLRTPAEQAVNRILESPRFQSLWENANRIAHQTLLVADNGDDPTAPGCAARIDHGADHGPAAHGVDDLWQVPGHARALARGEDDGGGLCVAGGH